MEKLDKLLNQIDRQGYKAYKKLQGRYQFGEFALLIDHVQGDPFADPSRCRLQIDAAVIKLPADLYRNRIRTIALEDFLGRRFAATIKRVVQGDRGSGKSGEVSIARYGQQVLERNAVLVDDKGAVELRFQLALPADGRSVNAHQARAMLFDELPQLVEGALLSVQNHTQYMGDHVDSVEDQQYLREQLRERGLVAFIADGAILPRASGIDDRPLADAVAFVAPESLAVSLRSIHGQALRGLGVPGGVTLIVGGGFHGKSTLLQAIERGVYNHIPGDGRERVVADANAVKVRAEDGRAVAGVDISAFINNLPQGKDTQAFSTENASGSTSQAANIMEALAAGSQTLLIDEDTSATNFMIRDQRMQALVHKDKEPITPLVQRIAELYSKNSISVVLVMGGSGDFFATADTVIMMDNYIPRDVTAEAKRLASPEPPTSVGAREGDIAQGNLRVLCPGGLSAKYQRDKERIQAFETRLLRYGRADIDVSRVEQLVDVGQLKAIGYLMRYYSEHRSGERLDLVAGLRKVLTEIESKGLDRVTPYIMGTLAMPRLQELVAVVNRVRGLKLNSLESS